jgi:predicted ATPase/DNA-binding XRE family transcriptional regulator
VDPITSFGAWLQRRRRALDLTQDELAGRVGLSVSAIRKIEGDERRPSREVAQLLAEVLEIPLEARVQFVKVARAELRTERLGEPQPPAPPPPPAAPPPARPVRLPLPLTPIVGRQMEMAEIQQLLRNHECRLLTIVGLGGAGKTRLAIEVAAALQSDFADGVFFVALASVSAPPFVPSAMAAALGLSYPATADLKTELVGYLQSREILLVLDNLEHLLTPLETSRVEDGSDLDGAELLASFLAQAPDVKLLVTSRTPLGIYGEWLFELQGLSTPELAGDPSAFPAAYSGRNSAIALFLQVAQRVQSSFALTPDNLPAIVRICELVEGLPLGIELAAAWVRTLSCPEIAAEIERSVDFLAATRRDVAGRHHSLRAVFDSSWKLLTSTEQEVISRLAVFPGTFTRQAAGQVASATLPLLSGLVAKSLLRRSEGDRYDLHPLIRQFAAEKLAESGADEETARRHLAFFLALAEAAEPHLTGAGQVEWLDQLEREHDNLRGALHWALDQCEREAALRLGSALRVFWEVRGHIAEGRRWLEQALTLGGAATPQLEGKAFQIAGQLALEQHDLPAALTLLERSLSLGRTAGDPGVIAVALSGLGRIAWLQRENEQAHRRYQEALALFRAEGNRQGVARVLNGLGLLAMNMHRLEDAARFLTEGIDLDEELGNHKEVARALFNLGLVYVRMESEGARAQSYFESSIVRCRQVGYVRFEAYAVNNLAMLTLHRGDAQQAMQLAHESLQLCRDVEDWLGACYALINVAHSALDLADPLRASQALHDAADLLRPGQDQEVTLWWLDACTRLAAAQGQPVAAVRLAGAAAAQRRGREMALPPTAQRYLDKTLHELRQHLDVAPYPAAEREGEAMTLDQAIQLAVSLL